jgi:hypothetical protein
MGKVHYIRRHGRRIAVETIDPGAVLKRKEKRWRDHFVRVPESWMEKQLPALTDTARWPAIVLLWLSFRHHGQVFICPNLERYGDQPISEADGPSQIGAGRVDRRAADVVRVA